MADRKNNPQLMADLLGYHLGLVDEETRARVEREYSKEELATARRAMKKLLAPLDAETPAQPPADLVGRIMSRVETVHATLPLPKPSPRMTPEADRGEAGRPLMRLRELIGLAAAIALFVGVFIPGYRTARQASQQAMCADNLRTIGNGYANYAEMFGDQMPYVPGPMPPGASWLRNANAGAPTVNNSRGSIELIRMRLVPAYRFVCQGRGNDRPLSIDTMDSLDGFPDARNNSYATNFIAKPQSRKDLDPDTPLVGDMNPLVETPTSPIDARKLPPNSRSHGGTSGGQNVLFPGISVRFVQSPNVGIDNDDIYRLIGVQEYTGRERPVLRSDAFLVP